MNNALDSIRVGLSREDWQLLLWINNDTLTREQQQARAAIRVRLRKYLRLCEGITF